MVSISVGKLISIDFPPKKFFISKNPFWEHAIARLFIFHKDGKPVGRIAAIIDHLFIKKEKVYKAHKKKNHLPLERILNQDNLFSMGP